MSVFDDGIYAAPWTEHGAEYGPISIRSGQMVSQSLAERDYRESIDGEGLWDHERAARARSSTHPCHLPTVRYDEAEMAAFVGNGSRLTARQYEVYMRFWVGHCSYHSVARAMDCTYKQVREAVQELRAKARRHLHHGGNP